MNIRRKVILLKINTKVLHVCPTNPGVCRMSYDFIVKFYATVCPFMSSLLLSVCLSVHIIISRICPLVYSVKMDSNTNQQIFVKAPFAGKLSRIQVEVVRIRSSYLTFRSLPQPIASSFSTHETVQRSSRPEKRNPRNLQHFLKSNVIILIFLI